MNIPQIYGSIYNELNVKVNDFMTFQCYELATEKLIIENHLVFVVKILTNNLDLSVLSKSNLMIN